MLKPVLFPKSYLPSKIFPLVFWFWDNPPPKKFEHWTWFYPPIKPTLPIPPWFLQAAIVASLGGCPIKLWLGYKIIGLF